VLKLSAWAARSLADCKYKTRLQVNWLATHTQDTYFEFLKTHRSSVPHNQGIGVCPDRNLPQRLWRNLISAVIPDEPKNDGHTSPIEWHNVSNLQLREIAAQITGSTYFIKSRNVNKDEFVTAGGVCLSEVDFRTMQSKIVPGLFFAGEYLDIDGLTGGYNFQAAWTTGWLAGRSIAERLKS
jgi:hypothetical protein